MFGSAGGAATAGSALKTEATRAPAMMTDQTFLLI
jgi:hypothetical protein